MPKLGLRLSDEERARIISVRESHRRKKEHWVCTRLRCLLLCDEGKTMRQAGEICEVSRSIVAEWIRAYRQGGIQAVTKRGPYQGKRPRLSPEQQQELREIIRSGPQQAGLDTGVWTASVVAAVVRDRFAVSLSLSQIRRTLRKLGFSVQYPKRKLAKADAEAQRTWREVELPRIKKGSSETKASWYTKTRPHSSRRAPYANTGRRRESDVK